MIGISQQERAGPPTDRCVPYRLADREVGRARDCLDESQAIVGPNLDPVVVFACCLVRISFTAAVRFNEMLKMLLFSAFRGTRSRDRRRDENPCALTRGIYSYMVALRRDAPNRRLANCRGHHEPNQNPRRPLARSSSRSAQITSKLNRRGPLGPLHRFWSLT